MYPISDDTIIFGILAMILGLVFYTESHVKFKKFYAIVPALLLCYFIPGLLNTFGVIDASNSKLYFVASRYLLPSTLVLLTLSVDLKEIFKLGPKMLIMFFAATISIMLGGPIALLILKATSPDFINQIGADQLWRGMSTIAGSWIGGGANQTSMKEVFNVADQTFSMMVIVDILLGNFWLACLLVMAGKREKIDKFFGADSSLIEELKNKMDNLTKKNEKVPATRDYMFIMAISFGICSFSHFFAGLFSDFFKSNYPWMAKFSLTSSFFWLVLIATTAGLMLSFTKLRKIEFVGAAKIGSVMLYVLVATIGMKMNFIEIFKYPKLFYLGFVWIMFHGIVMIIVAKLIKAPLFFLAVGSQANVGGAASAPVVASFFHPSLAPIGVLLAVFGYVVGTYGAWICAQLMRLVVGL